MKIETIRSHSKEPESEELEESEQPVPETPLRTIDLDGEDDVAVKVVFKMSKKLYRQLGKIAFDQEVSRALIIRQAITDYLKNREQPKTIIDDRELDKLLDSCTTDGGDGFEIDGEEGFIETMKANEFKLKDLTPKQWKKVGKKLNIGLAGYALPLGLEEFAAKFEELEPSEEQLKWLSTETPEEEKEETEGTKE